ncbi:MFS transporter permease [Dietzia sp. HMSC21D01]|uniref:MFS transporter n=1 Tax=Dietzia cinnamea TaxID=321318 RepID=A0AAW5Q6E7_9ACTN|nr:MULTISPECIES: MFS transporter [Dietzia]MCT1712435.1 MFS transporter [Dietzia cinnamea]MCT1864158.1 MFS transporter [Dietzia cinnamea]MCT2028811.1 MFS transporter [Dietzia cinnamea]MCT2032353.1 MFS transporter [Dietzia cinnamea]MCT2074939.1 MFS transporter [Dietzia cinnamea]
MTAPARGGDAGRSDENGLIAVLAFAGIVMSLSQTLVIPLLGMLPAILNTSAVNASWVVTITLLAGAVAGPVMGRLGDLYPKKYVLIGCTAVMVVGSVLCALAGSLWPMLIGRALQGVGIGVIPIGIATIREVLPAGRLAPAISLMSSSLGVGGALGLPAAAALAQYGSWQWMFWGSGALGVAIMALMAVGLRVMPAAKPDGTLDLVGALGLATALICLLLAVSKGADWGWGSPLTLGLLAAAAVALPAWALWVLRHPSPIVNLRVAARRPVLMTNIASVTVGMGLYAQLLIMPQILQLPAATGHGLGQSMVAMGLWSAPGGLAMMAVSPLSGRLISTRGPKITLILGSLVIAVGYASGLFLMGSTWGVMIVGIIVSGGVGLAYGAMPALIMASVPTSEMGSANSVNTLMRSIGTTTSAAVLGVLLTQMSYDFEGLFVPTETGFRVGLMFGCGVTLLAAAVAATIPPPWEDEDAPADDSTREKTV